MRKYDNLSDNEKTKIIKELYEQKYKSFSDIAELYGTYPNKVRRDAIRLDINIRNKSEAQKNALQTGKTKHPTKGKNRDEITKQKIGKSVMESWEQLDHEQLKLRQEKARKNWESMSEDDKKNILQKANVGVRKTSKEGSKLEKFILINLLKDGYKPQFHQEQSLLTTKLQIDIVVPSINVAIEIDGPSHFEPVWGSDVLDKNIKYDQKKEGLIIGKGMCLIRIKQTRDFSKTRALLCYNKLKELLIDIDNHKYTQKSFLIED